MNHWVTMLGTAHGNSHIRFGLKLLCEDVDGLQTSEVLVGHVPDFGEQVCSLSDGVGLGGRMPNISLDHFSFVTEVILSKVLEPLDVCVPEVQA